MTIDEEAINPLHISLEAKIECDHLHQEELQQARKEWLEEMEQEVADLRAEHANIARHGNDPDSAYDRVEGMLRKKKQDKTDRYEAGLNQDNK